MTYERHLSTSWIYDLIAAQRGDQAARARLGRHAHEFDVESRANPSTTAGTGGEFAPPVWLIPLFAPSAAGGRIIADLIDRNGNLFVSDETFAEYGSAAFEFIIDIAQHFEAMTDDLFFE